MHESPAPSPAPTPGPFGITPRCESGALEGKLRGKLTWAQLKEELSNSQSSPVMESATSVGGSGVSSQSLDVCRQRPKPP